MKIKPLILSMLPILATTYSHSAAMDQSGQSILAFLEDKNYVEASIAVVDPDVLGKVRDRPDLVNVGSTDLSTGDMAESFQYYNVALKLQIAPMVSFGLIYDQPFGAAVKYPLRDNNTFSDNKISQTGTEANVDTQNISMLFGFQPDPHFNLYAGGVYQTVKGNVKLRGNSMSIFNGYDADFKQDNAVGWLAGAAFQIPEIALKAAVTYRSEIKHKLQATESIFGEPLVLTADTKTEITTPQSVNLDFQTGVYKDTLAYLNARWVNWKQFELRPTQFGALTEMATGELSQGLYSGGFNLDDYHKDQYSVTLGLGHQFTEKWAASADVSWDSGTGNPASVLNPTKGGWGLGLGVQYNPAPNYFIAGGVKYLWIGDATAQDGTYYLPVPGISEIAQQGDYKDNTAIGYGLKMGYRF
ncbi:OmpP1/FadL family transporter [Acinetobacter wuhouensis]|uniref:Transporter n=1 Tax=Acinetobacter wuhouensis TaxID=1879050 RepID=A0A4Q7AIC7_9GAMM|nr:outer membrane protein transport protein [Acinetobacter wuhouensis]RZG48000.1 transporter [Acinetobacter wuhouensis]